jgi:transposase
MRGDEQRQAGFIVMTSLEDVVPADHPLRAIRTMVDAALEETSPELESLFASRGRPSIAPEYLLRAQPCRPRRCRRSCLVECGQ